MKDKSMKIGIIEAIISYVIWGLLPIYWKLLGHVPADEILANRIFWSFIFMIVYLFLTHKWLLFIRTLKRLKENSKYLWTLFLASLLISGNWFTYIWAVNSNQMVEASLGYYINPLVSFLLGVIFLREKLSKAQYGAFLLTAIGVFIMGLSYGKIPWIAFILAFSFGFYGLVKKMLKVDSAVGLTLETMAVSPIALGYIIFLFIQGSHMFLATNLMTDLLLIGAGGATAIPLLYFARGAQKIPLSMLGFFQYIAPTITLFLGVFVYGEEFTEVHFIAFLFIWIGLFIYSFSQGKQFKKRGVIEGKNNIKKLKKTGV